MPIYEYQCKQCDSVVEKRQSVSDEPLKVCEKCGGELAKKWSLSGIQFKGDGWYVTDYAAKKSGGEQPTGGEKTSSGEGEKSPSGGTKEKSSAGESTTTTETASKPASNTPKTTKTDSGAGKV